EIIRMLNSAFDDIGAKEGDYAPAQLLSEIDAINAEVYDAVNNGVYKAGFATEQVVYEEEVRRVFACLDSLEKRLGRQRFLVGDQLPEAACRLFTPLRRFGAVYYRHSPANAGRSVDYPQLWSYTRELCQGPGVAKT